MFKKIWQSIKENLQELDRKTILIYALVFLVASLLLGVLIRFLGENIGATINGKSWSFRPRLFLEPLSWLIGLAICLLLGTIYTINGGFRSVNKGTRMLKGKGGEKDRIEGSLENSRFLTDEERDKYFPPFTYESLPEAKQDGVPARAVLDKHGHLVGNFKPGVHALVIGATGSGKTTTFINPMIQLIGTTNCGSSMIMTDPKGELFDLHSGYLKSRGYNVMVLDLRDTYSSSRWNPLEPIWDAYQEYLKLGEGIVAHIDPMADYPDLKRMDGEAQGEEPWIEWNGRAYVDISHCKDDISVERQKIYDAMYEDLSDMVGGLIPVQNEKDPLWEKGARSIVQATILAMLEDSANPELEMTKEKFNLFNVSKALTDNTNNYQNLKEYFEGRGKLSQAYQLSRQVLIAPEATLGSYMSITMDKLSLFNDRGLCALTSATDIKDERFAYEPTALFLKIPDEKDTRHSLASLFILSTYKALIKVAT
ncbi:MAG: type IV secretory system conjugative DNA transfer family protein, partial [Oscillospiraceae bacterium]|nr:type IV secretory system conjugative DNA transfer family protein [Oscillospiraceae bacterium]